MKESIYTFIKKDRKDPGSRLLKGLLWLLSLLYGLLVYLRIFLFKAKILSAVRLPKPVISVGNITTGGTGKTPCVAYLLDHVHRRGKKAAILMRGYMQQQGKPSDEAAWYKDHAKDTPVLTGVNRAFEAQRFLNSGHCDIFIMDDGFQHLNLKRDLNIVLIDCLDPWGAGHLLPRGLLREPVVALSRADIFMITRSDQASEQIQEIEKKLAVLNAKALITHSVHQPVRLVEAKTQKEIPMGELRGKKGIACCSIGSPAAFERTLLQLKVDIAGSIQFMDHHHYSLEDVRKIIKSAAEKNVPMVLTTEKDLVKLREFLPEFPASIDVMVLQIELAVTKNENELLKRIDHLLQR